MSRELDAKVARAMGLCPHVWEYHEEESTFCSECGEQLTGPSPFDDYPQKQCRDCGKQVRGLAFHVDGQPDCKPYSTDIAAAWQIIEWMTSRRWLADLECLPCVPRPLWFISFCYYMDGQSNRKKGYAEGEIIAEVVCRAFLEAMRK